MAKNLIRRYIWLIDTIRSCPDGITFEEINRKWQKSMVNEDGDPMPKRTFHAHIEAILDEFDIEITCNRNDGYRYKIEDEVNEYGSIRSTLVDSLVLGNTVAEMPAMKNRVYISTDFAEKNIGIILKAIRDVKILKVRRLYVIDKEIAKMVVKEIGYPPQDQDDTYVIEPYALTFRQYWFLVCKDTVSHEMMVLALNRLVEIEITDQPFDYPEDFDIKHYVDSIDPQNHWKDRFDRNVHINDDMDALDDCLISERSGMI